MRHLIMEYNPKISIIVPMYNSESTIGKCIESILQQTLSELEVILVNDGSTDNTLDICKKYSKRDSRIVVVSQENKGLISARKRGVEISSADLIGFVDSDDWIEKDMYENLYEIFNNYHVDVVSSGIFRDYIEEQYTNEVLDNFEQGYYENINKTVYPYMLWNKKINDFGIYCTLVNKLFKREILKTVYDNIDERVFYGEDCLTFFSYMMRCKKVYILNKSYYHYVINHNSMCSKTDDRLLTNTYYLYKGLEKVFLGYGELTYRLLEQLKYYILSVESHTLMKLYNLSLMSLMNARFGTLDIKGENVILYGAGGSSRVLYNHLIEDCECIVVAWVDKYPDGKDMLCLHKIESRNIITDLEYDYIVISVISEELYISIKNELKELYGIDDKKIMWGKVEFDNFRI
jgi:glycosyltransferase involved in cell wall biosynthesis